MEVRIEDLAHDGRGIGHVAGKAVFVHGALPGELVKPTRVHQGRQYDEARECEVLEASPDRVSPQCPHIEQCSGCSLQHFAPAGQIRAKQKMLADQLSRIGGVEPEEWLAPLQREAWAYRRKARLSVRYVEKKGRALVGFREDNGRYVADLSRCEVLDARVGPLLSTLADLVTGLDSRRDIPQIEMAAAERVVLVLRHLKPLSAADRARLSEFGVRHGIDWVLQPAGLDSLRTLDDAPPAALHYELPQYQLRFAYQPLDFVQVHATLNQAMIDQAMHWLAPQPGERVLDLYCGLGNFTLPIARLGAQVLGVEGDAGLVARARAGALANGLAEVEFIQADLYGEGLGAAPFLKQAYDKLLLDPPRAGAESVLQHLPGAQARRIVYVSCHPGTLARDTRILIERHGFRLRAAGVMDMFPHTTHVESMAVFVRD